jgi:hypothetical protein
MSAPAQAHGQVGDTCGAALELFSKEPDARSPSCHCAGITDPMRSLPSAYRMHLKHYVRTVLETPVSMLRIINTQMLAREDPNITMPPFSRSSPVNSAVCMLTGADNPIPKTHRGTVSAARSSTKLARSVHGSPFASPHGATGAEGQTSNSPEAHRRRSKYTNGR